MRISILGCGWLGLPLAAALVEDGHEVRGSTTTPGKLGEIEAAGATPHLIKLAPEPEGQTDDFFGANLLIVTIPPRDAEVFLQRLASALAVARSQGTPWFLYTSSTSAYDARGTVVDETDPTPPATARSKRMRDAESLFLTPPVDATILRLGGLYGPGRDPGAFLAGKQQVSGPDQPVNLVHRDDVIGVVRAVIEQDARNQIFNVVADEHPSKRAFYTARANAAGLEPPTFADDAVPGKTVSNRKVKDVLGYAFQHQPTI